MNTGKARERLAFIYSEQRQLRMDNKVEESAVHLGKYRALLEELAESEALEEWSTFWYEEANIQKLLGHPEESMAAFQKNSEFAEKLEDPVGSLNAKYHMNLMRYLSGSMEPGEAYDFFIYVEETARALRNE